jgi:DNA polymerase-1
MKYDIVLVDGDNLCWRNYYSLAEMSYNGMKTGAIFGTIKSLLAIYKKYEPESLWMTWTHSSNFRRQIYPEYKAGRKKQEDYYPQRNELEKILSYIGINQVMVHGYEADDIIGAIAHDADQEKLKTLIVSADKDLLQLIGHTTFVLRSNKLYNFLMVHEEFGCSPKNIPLHFGVVGDKSDNIQGVPGIGKVKIRKLFEKFGDDLLRYILEDYNTDDKDLIKLKKHKSIIERNLKLIKLNPNSVTPSNNLITKRINQQEVVRAIEKYGMTSLLKEVLEFME